MDARLRGILNRLQKLKEIATLGNLVAESEETRYKPDIDSKGFTYNKWTLLKLMFLQLYTPLYVSIIRHRFAEFNYIDLFAGSGLNRLEDTNVLVAGSPLIAPSFAPAPFSRAYLVDRDPDKIALLKKRIEYLKELSMDERNREVIFSDLTSTDFWSVARDANEVVGEIFKEIEQRHKELLKKRGRGCHNLIFIDPFGLDFRREALERILNSNVRSDVIILFNSYTAGMNAYNAINFGYSAKRLDEHLGEEWLDFVKQRAREMGKKMEEMSRNELSATLSQYYVKILCEKDRVAEVVRLPLRLESQQYDLIFTCRRTKTGNPFLAGVRYIKDLLESTDYALVDALKEYVVTGRLPGMLRYIIRDPEKALERYKTARRYGILKSQEHSSL